MVPLEELVLAPLEVVVADVELLDDAEWEWIPHDDVTETVGLAIDDISLSIGLQSSNQDQGEHTVLVQCKRQLAECKGDAGVARLACKGAVSSRHTKELRVDVHMNGQRAINREVHTFWAA